MPIYGTNRFSTGKCMCSTVSGIIQYPFPRSIKCSICLYDSTAGKSKSEKVTKWIKMKRCVGIHSNVMTSSPIRKRTGDGPIFQQVSPNTAIPTLNDCYNGLQPTFTSVLL